MSPPPPPADGRPVVFRNGTVVTVDDQRGF